MNSLFGDLRQGLEEAISFEKGNSTARVRTFVISPVKEYNHMEIRNVRLRAGMTQTIFAHYMGVSKKTVEAWECGRTHPTGPAFRLLSILDDEKDFVPGFIQKA